MSTNTEMKQEEVKPEEVEPEEMQLEMKFKPEMQPQPKPFQMWNLNDPL